MTWEVGTNYAEDYDGNTTFSHRFVADQSKAELGKDYAGLRDSAILACELQERAESFVRYPSTNRPDLTTTAELLVKARTAGWTIMLNRAAISLYAAIEDTDVSIEDVLGKGAASSE